MGLQSSTGAELVDDTFDDVAAVTPSDTIDDAHRLRGTRGVWADVGGTLKVITNKVAAAADKSGAVISAANGVTLTVVSGQVLRLDVAYVLATGTAATGIKAFS